MLLLATLFLMQHPSGESHLALLARDLVPSTAKRLAMFVLRSRVTVRAVDAPRILGVGGPAAAKTIEAAFAVTPASSSVAMSMWLTPSSVSGGFGRFV